MAALEEQSTKQDTVYEKILSTLQQKPMKAASLATEGDFNRMKIQDHALTIPKLSDKTFSEVYNPILSSLEFAEELKQVRYEVPDFQRVTSRLLNRLLNAIGHDKLLSIRPEVGFNTREFGMRGYADKVCCMSKCPEENKASTLDDFDTSLLCLGVWEDKGLNVPLGKKHMAQLGSQVTGLVEAALRIHGIRYTRFSGILCGVKDGDSGKRMLSCRCFLWGLDSNFCERRRTSIEFSEPIEVASAIHWWILESMDQVKFLDPGNQYARPTLSLTELLEALFEDEAHEDDHDPEDGCNSSKENRNERPSGGSTMTLHGSVPGFLKHCATGLHLKQHLVDEMVSKFPPEVDERRRWTRCFVECGMTEQQSGIFR